MRCEAGIGIEHCCVIPALALTLGQRLQQLILCNVMMAILGEIKGLCPQDLTSDSHWQGMQSEQCNVKEVFTGARRGQNIFENSGLETESTEESCPWHQIKWPECQCNANEPNSYIKVACNYSEDKDLQNESYRAGLSYKPSILEELKVNFKLLHQA